MLMGVIDLTLGTFHGFVLNGSAVDGVVLHIRVQKVECRGDLFYGQEISLCRPHVPQKTPHTDTSLSRSPERYPPPTPTTTTSSGGCI